MEEAVMILGMALLKSIDKRAPLPGPALNLVAVLVISHVH